MDVTMQSRFFCRGSHARASPQWTSLAPFAPPPLAILFVFPPPLAPLACRVCRRFIPYSIWTKRCDYRRWRRVPFRFRSPFRVFLLPPFVAAHSGFPNKGRETKFGSHPCVYPRVTIYPHHQLEAELYKSFGGSFVHFAARRSAHPFSMAARRNFWHSKVRTSPIPSIFLLGGLVLCPLPRKI